MSGDAQAALGQEALRRNRRQTCVCGHKPSPRGIASESRSATAKDSVPCTDAPRGEQLGVQLKEVKSA